MPLLTAFAPSAARQGERRHRCQDLRFQWHRNPPETNPAQRPSGHFHQRPRSMHSNVQTEDSSAPHTDSPAPPKPADPELDHVGSDSEAETEKHWVEQDTDNRKAEGSPAMYVCNGPWSAQSNAGVRRLLLPGPHSLRTDTEATLRMHHRHCRALAVARVAHEKAPSVTALLLVSAVSPAH